MARPKRQRFYEEECKVDRISLLPDELLVSILRLLKFKEATATSILARRWRYLHTWTCKLDLDGEKSIKKLMKIHSSLDSEVDSSYMDINYSYEEICRRAQKYVDEERCCFIKWADSIISTRRSSTLEEFRLFFNLDKSNSPKIDEWLRSALSRGIEKLDLILTAYGEFSGSDCKKSYDFPYHVVEFDKLKMLKKLSLRRVNITGDFLKEVVHECRCLEELSVSHSDILFLEIVDPSPSLKSIAVSRCSDLKSLMIRNSNVVTLKFMPLQVRISPFVLENVPLLVEFWCWTNPRMMSMVDIRHMLWSLLPQLRLLKFTAYQNIDEEDIRNLFFSYRSSTLEEFRLFFNLDKSNSPKIDEWLRFALSRGIEKLDLILTTYGQFSGFDCRMSYSFPYHVVEFDKLKMLKKLSLRCVSINGDFLKEVVQKCRCLEELSVSHSDILFVEIVDPSPSLKSIAVCMCSDLKSLVIRNSNVVTLKFMPGQVRISPFVLENVPLLIEFWFWPNPRIMSMVDIRHMLWSLLPQLRLLKFTASHNNDEEDIRNFCSGVELSNLQQLMVLVLSNDIPLLPLINILNVSPRLEKFVIERHRSNRYPTPSFRKMELVRCANKKIPKKYPCLKELKMVEYNGTYYQFEMLMHLVGNGVALKDIVVDPQCVQFYWDDSWEFSQQQISSKKHARLSLPAQALNKYLPSRINIHIL